MNLCAYLALGRGRSARLARAIGVHPVFVSQWVKGTRPVPLERAIEIEKATLGLVTCEELLPWYAHLIRYMRKSKAT